MDLTPVFVVGFIVLGIYKVIELFVRRRERLMLMEKLDGEALGEFIRNGGLPQSSFPQRNTGIRFGVLHFAAAVLGLGIGMVCGFSVLFTVFSPNVLDHLPWYLRNMCEAGSVLLFVGLALVISFIVEYKLTSKKNG